MLNICFQRADFPTIVERSIRNTERWAFHQFSQKLSPITKQFLGVKEKKNLTSYFFDYTSLFINKDQAYQQAWRGKVLKFSYNRVGLPSGFMSFDPVVQRKFFFLGKLKTGNFQNLRFINTELQSGEQYRDVYYLFGNFITLFDSPLLNGFLFLEENFHEDDEYGGEVPLQFDSFQDYLEEETLDLDLTNASYFSNRDMTFYFFLNIARRFTYFFFGESSFFFRWNADQGGQYKGVFIPRALVVFQADAVTYIRKSQEVFFFLPIKFPSISQENPVQDIVSYLDFMNYRSHVENMNFFEREELVEDLEKQLQDIRLMFETTQDWLTENLKLEYMFFHDGFIHNTMQKIYKFFMLSSTYVVSIKKVGLFIIISFFFFFNSFCVFFYQFFVWFYLRFLDGSFFADFCCYFYLAILSFFCCAT